MEPIAAALFHAVRVLLTLRLQYGQLGKRLDGAGGLHKDDAEILIVRWFEVERGGDNGSGRVLLGKKWKARLRSTLSTLHQRRVIFCDLSSSTLFLHVLLEVYKGASPGQ